MVGVYRLKREKQYPMPHDINLGFMLGADDTSTGYCTTIPAIHHDEACLPSNKYTHPEHASFTETDASQCCPESKIFKIKCALRVTLKKQSVVTDNVQALRFGVMSIHGAFEDFDADDELTSVTVGDCLEITKESTDRQSYPIYDGTDLSEKYAGSSTLDATAMGLTTDTKLENVAFDPDLYYDMLNYYTNGDKLKRVQNGLRWFTLTQDNPTRVIHFTIKSNVKYINPYSILAHMIFLPKAGTRYQIPIPADVTNVQHLICDYRCRYLEWNDNYNHQRA